MRDEGFLPSCVHSPGSVFLHLHCLVCATVNSNHQTATQTSRAAKKVPKKFLSTFRISQQKPRRRVKDQHGELDASCRDCHFLHGTSKHGKHPRTRKGGRTNTFASKQRTFQVKFQRRALLIARRIPDENTRLPQTTTNTTETVHNLPSIKLPITLPTYHRTF